MGHWVSSVFFILCRFTYPAGRLPKKGAPVSRKGCIVFIKKVRLFSESMYGYIRRNYSILKLNSSRNLPSVGLISNKC